jgi:hypothetical protein
MYRKIEEEIKVRQPTEYEWLERHRSRVTLFFMWLERKLDKVMGVLK